MKKIGIFTLTDALNYGAFYQMFALQAYIKENYKDIDVVVYRPEESLIRTLKNNLALNPIRLIRKQNLKRRFNQNKTTVSIKIYKNEPLDIAFIGSDEIWNVDNKSFDNNPNFFGLKIIAKKKIGYAPSMGYSNFSSFNKLPHFKEGIKNLDAIYFRDNHTKYFLDKIGVLNSERVLDPTLLYDNWERHIKKIEKRFDKKYIVYYSYVSNPPFLRELLHFAKKNNFLIISAGYKTHNWADYNLVLSPWQFLDLLQGSEAVFTTTFHGSIMSLLFNKKVIIHESSEKVKDLVRLFNIKYCVLNDSNTSVEQNFNCFDFKEINNLKKEFQNSSRLIIEKLLK